MAINIVLADDHPLIRAGIRTTLCESPDIVLIGEATNGDEVKQMCLETQIDILLLDIRMPGISAAETISYLKEHRPLTKVIILTAYEDETYVRNFLSMGVKGYLLKDEATEAVIRAIHIVYEGDTWFSPQVIHILSQSNETESTTLKTSFSERQFEILYLLKDGMTTNQISKTLSITERTVRYHIENILSKLDAKNRVEAVSKAVEAGIIVTNQNRIPPTAAP